VCSEGWRGGGCEQALRPRHAHWWFPLDVDLAALTPLEAAALGFVGVGLLTLSAALLCLLLLWRRALVMRAMAAAHPHHTAAVRRSLRTPPHPPQPRPTAMQKSRIVILGFGAARQKMALERCTKPKTLWRDGRSCRYLTLRRGVLDLSIIQ
jgi:hypothetical protein